MARKWRLCSTYILVRGKDEVFYNFFFFYFVEDDPFFYREDRIIEYLARAKLLWEASTGIFFTSLHKFSCVKSDEGWLCVIGKIACAFRFFLQRSSCAPMNIYFAREVIRDAATSQSKEGAPPGIYKGACWIDALQLEEWKFAPLISIMNG